MELALVCIANNEDNYIREWLLYNKFLGFDKIFIYQNNWRIQPEILDIFGDLLCCIKFDGKYQQLIAYNHFISEFSSKFDWAVFIDCDEFIYLKKHDNIKNFIADYSKCEAISINWALFGDNGHKIVRPNNYSLLERFTKRQKLVCPQVKTLISLHPKIKGRSFKKKSIKMRVHHCNGLKSYDTNMNRVIGPWNYLGDYSVAQINHYFCKTFEEFHSKISRGKADSRGKRNIGEFYSHNFNEIDDYDALNFFNHHKKLSPIKEPKKAQKWFI
jgi:hypothetical protein